MTAQQLPEDWQVVKFGDIARHISKRVEPSETELGIYVGLEHLDPDSLKIKRHGAPSDVDGQKLLVKKGQIIFGKRRAYQRKVAVAEWDCICSAHAMVLEAKRDRVIPEFLPLFMQSEIFMSRAIAISEGSLSPTIKWKALSEQKFLLPPKTEQLKFIEAGAKISKGSLALAEAILASQRLYASIAKKMLLGHNDYSTLFGKSKTLLPEGWRLVRLGDVLERVQYGTSDVAYENGAVPVLRMMNIENGKITDTELKYSKLPISELESIKLQPGDILFNRTNSMELVGKTGLFNLKGDYVFASYMLRLEVKNSIVTPEFVNRYLNLPVIQYRLKAFATPGVSQANINQSSLKALPFLLPPLSEVLEADKVLGALDDAISELKQSNLRHIGIQKSVREMMLES